MSDAFGEKKGVLELYRTNEEMKMEMFPWVLINGPLLQLPLLFGVPMANPEYIVSYEVRIYNSNKRLLGKYKRGGKARSKIAAYQGYNGRDTFFMVYVEAAKEAFAEIREKIREDVIHLNSWLMRSAISD
jgi:hypothetical protein